MLQDLTDEEEILKRAFQFFDKDGNGEISVVELKTTMHELGDLLSEEEIHAFMAIMDVNNDGVIGVRQACWQRGWRGGRPCLVPRVVKAFAPPPFSAPTPTLALALSPAALVCKLSTMSF